MLIIQQRAQYATELCDHKVMRSQRCAGLNTPPLSTGAVHATINRKYIYSPLNRVVLPTGSHTGSCKCFQTVHHTMPTRLVAAVGRTLHDLRQQLMFRKVWRKSDLSIQSTIYAHTRELSLNPNSNTLERNRPQHDRPAACVIVLQYYSANFVSLCFHSRNEKLGAFKRYYLNFKLF
jgi:hypothetical protein